MKDTNPGAKTITPQLVDVRKDFKGYTPPSKYQGLVEVLADIIDTAAAGRECYATFGLSRQKDLIMLTITYAGSKLYASGVSLQELSDNAKLLL